MTRKICSIDGCERPGGLKGKWCHMHYRRWLSNGDPLLKRKPGRKPKPDAERFWPNVNKTEGGCWLWTAGLDVGGYGRFQTEGHETGAHRWSYESMVGPIPDGLHLDHLCRTRNCVNPAHLEPVTRAENLRRGAMAKHLEATGRPWNGPKAGIPDSRRTP